jgi:hypothetical protein
MDIENASVLLHWVSQTFREGGVGIIMYEPIGGHDAFGKMMIRNLAVTIPYVPLLTPRRLEGLI